MRQAVVGLLAHVDEIQGATAIVVVAGMEGALASVVGGLAACPTALRLQKQVFGEEQKA